MITSIWTGLGETPQEAYSVRKQVFCNELGISEAQERDVSDAFAWHLAFLDDGKPMGAGRITYISAGVASFSRVCILPEYRNQGIGDGLVKMMILKAESIGIKEAVLDCPRETAGFFKTIGFEEAKADPATGLLRMGRELGIGFKCHCTDQ